MSVTDVSLDALVRTRTALHGLAEHVLTVAGRAATGSIRLYVHDGALSTPDLDATGGRILMRENGLARVPDGRQVGLGGTFGELAAAMGVDFGLTAAPYHVATDSGPDDVVDVDPAAASLLLAAWRTGDAALRRFAPEALPVVWPEHFDVAITVDAVNYGVSPGDGYEPWPYAYVGPHDARTGDFWNAPFGAARRLSELDGVQAVTAFFERGRAEAS